jgi:hypothetical protein
MRRLAIVVLGFSLAAASAQAETATWGGSKKPIQVPAQKWAPLPGSEPYHPHAAPAAPGSTNGGEGFKPYTPFKGGSVYSRPDPAKPKSRAY